MFARFFALAFAFVILVSTACEARVWTTLDGEKKIEADLVDFDKTNCVLRKEDGKLVFVKIAELSKADQEYLQSKEAVTIHDDAPEAYRNWTLKDGRKIVGQVADFAKKTITLTRKDGKVFVDETPFGELEDWQKYVVLGIASHQSQTNIDTEKKLGTWLTKFRPPSVEISCEGVALQLKDHERFAAPFYMFSEEDQAYLQQGWDKWLEIHNANQDKTKETPADLQALSEELSLHLRSRSRLDAEARALSMKANQLRIEEAFGMSQWRVNLVPKPGVNARPTQVVVPGRDSREAMLQASQRYPQYNVAGVSKVGTQQLGYAY